MNLKFPLSLLLLIFCFQASFVLAQSDHASQEKEVRNKLDILFNALANKQLDGIKDYFSEGLSVSGYDGDLAVKILQAMAFQAPAIEKYEISKIEEENGELMVQVTQKLPEEDQFDFKFDREMKFTEINMFEVQTRTAPATKSSAINQPVSVPFTMFGNLIMFSAKINGQGQDFNFIFDTGASTTVINEKTAQKLGITSEQEMSATGASGSHNYKLATVASISVDQIKLEKVTSVLVNLDHLGNGEIDAIIGNTLLSKYVTEINYDNMTLTFSNQLESFTYNRDQYIDFKFDGGVGIPQITGTITLENGEKLSGKMFVDTGADIAIMMNSRFSKKHKLPQKFDKKVTMKFGSLTTEEGAYETALPSFDFGPLSFKDVPTVLSTSTSGVNAMKGYLGILGNHVLKRYNWIFDYSTKKAYYQANKNTKTAFKYPFAGISVHVKDDRLVIRDVNTGTQAEKLGLQEGFEVMSVNGLTVKEYNKIQALLRTDQQPLKVVFKNKKGKKKEIEYIATRLL